MGKTYFFNISGGCPFLRKDLKEIIILAANILKPSIIHIPTNCLAPAKILRMTEDILEWLKQNKPDVKLTIKPSFDGIGEKHDEIRGVKGNYEKLLKTYSGLKKLKIAYPNLEVGLGTVISKMNYDHIDKIIEKIHELEPDSYINEIAENRDEMFNVKSDIMPNHEEYASAVAKFEKYYSNLDKGKKSLKILLRTIYYREVIRYLEGKKERFDCYAGISNCHIDPYGNLWACCILGNSKPLGNLREENYDFRTVWHSEQAKDVLRSIKNKECNCPLANQFYSNVLLNGRGVLAIIKQYLS